MNRKILIWSIIILLIDQISKYLIQIYEPSISIIKNIFSIDYITNEGASWGILGGHITFLIIVSIIMILVVYSLMFSYENTKLNNFIFGLIFGGIFGNFIDRIIFGYVRDFISVGSFPVFNIADSAIVSGIILLLIISIKGDIKNGNSIFRRRKNKSR